jgi:hypothetical protein
MGPAQRVGGPRHAGHASRSATACERGRQHSAKFHINHDITGAQFRKTVEAGKFRHEGDYFNFYVGAENKVYAVAAKHVHTIEKEADSN